MDSYLLLPKDVVKSKITKNLKKILWMTRLRSLIVLERSGCCTFFFRNSIKKLNIDERTFRKDVRKQSSVNLKLYLKMKIMQE